MEEKKLDDVNGEKLEELVNNQRVFRKPNRSLRRSNKKKKKISARTRFELERTRTIGILAKMIGGFLDRNQAMFVEYDNVKHLVCWDEDGLKIRIQSAEDFEGFKDGMLLERKDDQPNPDLYVEKTEIDQPKEEIKNEEIVQAT